MKPLLQRISIDQNICFGKLCIRGTRIWVSLLFDLLADGMTMDDILIEYLHLTREDFGPPSLMVRKCLVNAMLIFPPWQWDEVANCLIK